MHASLHFHSLLELAGKSRLLNPETQPPDHSSFCSCKLAVDYISPRHYLSAEFRAVRSLFHTNFNSSSGPSGAGALRKMSYLADKLKEQGNAAFRDGEYIKAEELYTQAVQKYSQNPLIFTNRANVRLKLQKWEGAVNDCLKSIDITQGGQNHKAFYFLGKE